ncbi:radical SAM family heme chaperone HemW [uncultured Campylobacter sp.]|uniref:radical SAM family heme chaperone HemW n=1 Tax=uncultured Campylobacter sp. TaxID=218934 RepID=UPI00262FE299|nr:radical SAM family heme chaperone HemW [uncultured Campylobacter sp.]
MQHLYIHIPFCESKCNYCAFTSLSKKYEKEYFKALMKDLKFYFRFLNIKKQSIKTLFIGGGTPSIVDAKFYEEIFKFLNCFLNDKCEITSEANPNSSNEFWLKEMKNFGVNRLSFGAQSFNEKKLKFLGRNHGQKSIYDSINNAFKLGFKNINLDLIYDTKLDDKKMLNYEISHLKSIKNLIKHISAYNISIEKNTAFANKEHFKKNAYLLMKYFINSIKELGFKQYEISNFGKICKHNLAYWQGKEYLACGLSSVSFYKKQRFYTHKTLKEYIQNPIFRSVEKLDDKSLNLEHLFLGLRSVVGINSNKISQEQREKAFFLSRAKKLVYNERKKKFFNPNYLLSDELALFLQE